MREWARRVQRRSDHLPVQNPLVRFGGRPVCPHHPNRYQQPRRIHPSRPADAWPGMVPHGQSQLGRDDPDARRQQAVTDSRGGPTVNAFQPLPGGRCFVWLARRYRHCGTGKDSLDHRQAGVGVDQRLSERGRQHGTTLYSIRPPDR